MATAKVSASAPTTRRPVFTALTACVSTAVTSDSANALSGPTFFSCPYSESLAMRGLSSSMWLRDVVVILTLPTVSTVGGYTGCAPRPGYPGDGASPLPWEVGCAGAGVTTAAASVPWFFQLVQPVLVTV